MLSSKANHTARSVANEHQWGSIRTRIDQATKQPSKRQRERERETERERERERERDRVSSTRSNQANESLFLRNLYNNHCIR